MAKTGPKPLSLEEAWRGLLVQAVKDGDCLLVVHLKPFGHGYRHTRAGGKSWHVHKLAYFMQHGNKGNVVRHTCDRPNCINHEHLISGTQAENIADKVAKGRHPKGSISASARLTEAQVLEIFHAEGTYAELGRKYGIARGGIHNIKSGRSWSHLTGVKLAETRTKSTLALANLEDFR